MGTRSLTHIFKGDTEICCIYRQMDGYPSGHGIDLAKFTLSRRFVNGISGSALEVFNGAGCFAALLISHLKGNEAGHIYIYAPGSTDCDEEYVYNVRLGDYDAPGVVSIECIGVYKGKTLFKGSAEKFLQFCEKA